MALVSESEWYYVAFCLTYLSKFICALLKMLKECIYARG